MLSQKPRRRAMIPTTITCYPVSRLCHREPPGSRFPGYYARHAATSILWTPLPIYYRPSPALETVIEWETFPPACARLNSNAEK